MSGPACGKRNKLKIERKSELLFLVRHEKAIKCHFKDNEG
jgi:hypothetical protein